MGLGKLRMRDRDTTCAIGQGVADGLGSGGSELGLMPRGQSLKCLMPEGFLEILKFQ
jgi:hypothetical protein